MVRLETVFSAVLGLTPEFAAELSQVVSRFHADIRLSCEGKKLRLDSLIGILALDLHRGVKVEVLAEGEDEQAAASAICAKLAGREN